MTSFKEKEKSKDILFFISVVPFLTISFFCMPIEPNTIIDEPPEEYMTEKPTFEFFDMPNQIVGFSRIVPFTKLDDVDIIDDYYRGTYEDEVTNIVKAVSEYLVGLERAGGLPINAAVVFDVDDTLLSTHPTKRAASFQSGMPTDFYPPIRQVCDLYRSLKQKGLRILIITGRHEEHRSITEANLKWAGVDGWDTLIMRSLHEKGVAADRYKSWHRSRLSAKYRIVLNIGDQYSDLIGSYGGYNVKLPNRMYTIL